MSKFTLAYNYGISHHTFNIGKEIFLDSSFSLAVEQELYSKFDPMLILSVIEKSNSSWCIPVTMTIKANMKKEFCMEARRLNDLTDTDAFGFPIIEELLSRLKDTYFFNTIDLMDVIWQITLDYHSRPLTAFTVPGRVLYHFPVLPFLYAMRHELCVGNLI